MSCVANMEGCADCVKENEHEGDCDDVCRLLARMCKESEITHRQYHIANQRGD